MSHLVKTGQNVLKNDCTILHLTRMNALKVPIAPPSLSVIDIDTVLDFTRRNRCAGIFHCHLMCNSLMTYDSELTIMCLFVICVSLLKFMFRSFVHVLIGLLCPYC
jgi:hypothetical protein